MICYDDYTIEETELEDINSKYNEIIEELDVEYHLHSRDSFVVNSVAEEDKVRRTLEMMGSKIISASDVESNRKIEYRFWQDDKEFRKYKESNNVVGTEVEGDSPDDEVVSLVDLLSEDTYGISDDDKNEILDWSYVLDYKDKKQVRILLESVKEKSYVKGSLEKEIMDLYIFLHNKVNMSNREKEIVKLLNDGYKQSDISYELGVSKQSVSNSLSRLVDKIIKQKALEQ